MVGIAKFYITTAIDYVNAAPHLGHLYEKVCADALARYHRLKGDDVFFLTGTDENAQKNEQAARRAGVPTKEFVDRNAAKFKELCKTFAISYDDFIRTTEDRHVKVAQLIFKKLYDRGYIYKSYYEGLYCPGCEEFKQEKDLVDGKCPEHGVEPELVKEENYFFKLSEFEKEIEQLLKSERFVYPEKWRAELLARLKEGLRDLSVSRPNLTWGITTPIDPNHKIYVWIDALANYISALGYPDGERYRRYWPADVHLIGKGITWFHAVIWPAILLAAEIPLPKLILVHGYVTVEGRKMSKSLGNVVDPLELTKRYQVDAIRYYLLREIAFGSDGDFSENMLRERINNELVANLGNFIYRTMSFLWKEFGGKVPEPAELDASDRQFSAELGRLAGLVAREMEGFRIDRAVKLIRDFSSRANQYFQLKEPWDTKDSTCLYLCANAVASLAIVMGPFMPIASESIWKQLNLEGSVHEQRWERAASLILEPGHEINEPRPLFKKVDSRSNS